jgi:phage protein D
VTLHELVTLIAAAGTLTVAATSGFVNPQSAEVSSAGSKPEAVASSGAAERSQVVAGQVSSPRSATAEKEPRSSQAPKSARCEASTGAHQASAASDFCPLRVR